MKIVANGQSLPEAYLKDSRRVGSGTHVKVTVMGQVMVDADYRIRDDADPIEVDYLIARPDGTRFVQLGIMCWEGDDITSCFAPPGIPRPTAFESPKGSGLVLSTWRRIQG